MSCNFNYQSYFYRPEFLETLVRNLVREDAVENNEERVRSSLEAIVSCAEVMLRELAEAEAEKAFPRHNYNLYSSATAREG